MNPGSLDEAKNIATKVRLAVADMKDIEVVICPPFPFIASCIPRSKAKNFYVGAQSVSLDDKTPHTGEVGVTMLKDIGVEYVIVGHSEQRARGDTDEIISKQVKILLGDGITPIVCIGENSRDETGSYLDAVKNQIKGSLAGIPKKYYSDIVIAYEPVWAIGAKESMRPEDIYETSLFVKKVYADIFGAEAGLRVRVLYGGSANHRNASDIMKIGHADGLLVGRESVSVPEFIQLMKSL